jgi:anti-sigma factor RsiW
MISCEQAKDHLGAYYDGECDESLRQELASHLASCSGCRHALDEWVLLSSRVFSQEERKAPPYLWTRVLAGIEAQERQPAAWWLEWRWMARVTMAASLFIGLASVYLLRQSTVPLEAALEGRSDGQAAIQLASASVNDYDATVSALVAGEVWAEN